MAIFLSQLLFLVGLTAAQSGNAQWSDFADNFASDLAPIIALFGEQVTKQFLSESTSFLDNIIFGVAPLGILTAVVSVIRVYGSASLSRSSEGLRSLMLSFFGYASWATFFNDSLYDDKASLPPLWSFCLTVVGTVFIVTSMTLCAMLIERKSEERTFFQDIGKSDSSTLFWLQRGGQRIGDQPDKPGKPCLIKGFGSLDEAIAFIKSEESPQLTPNKAARILYYRSRLAYLASESEMPIEPGWGTEVHEMAVKLQTLLEESMGYIFSSIGMPEIRKDTRSSLLQLIAQDIFTIFIDDIADVLAPLQGVNWRQSRATVSNPPGPLDEQPYLELMNTHVEYLADKLAAAGIGSKEDALMSIVPALAMKWKLPLLEESLNDLLLAASTHRRSGRYELGQDLLTILLNSRDAPFNHRVIMAMGQLYRAACRSLNQTDHYLGVNGFEKMMRLKFKEGAESLGSLDRYKGLGEFYSEGARAIQRGSTWGIDCEWLSVKEMLTIADKTDLAKQSNKELVKLLKLAIEQGCPELVEDIWTANVKLIHEEDDEGRTPIFWAIDKHYYDTETFRTLLEWLGIPLDLADRRGTTPLAFARKSGIRGAADLLLQRMSDLEARKKTGNPWPSGWCRSAVLSQACGCSSRQ
ncbi:unnamed protein product [Parascedosporium putredinis]|uniref:Uncharacterized protein n=1 Tax=Parascedosporium putredinis TaxID=1442378 RepID=A0A9P1H833_9PEZI|nr:unnamed protein product [Parascedosporium putredinis]CAI8000301.1 unnamed protein product [Parascedosporium putredinis]